MLICVGLAVDYAAHIAHMFKDERAQRAKGLGIRVEGLGARSVGCGNGWPQWHVMFQTIQCTSKQKGATNHV